MVGRGGVCMAASVSSRLGDSWTPSNLLACWGQPCYHSHKDQILGLEHDQCLWDLSRREAYYHNPIKEDQETAWDYSPVGC